MKDKLLSIALDGPSGAGKSTVAKAVAQQLDILYLDTGAMYRAIGLSILRAGIDLADAQSIADAADSIAIDVRYQNGAQRVYLAGEDVSEAIRTPDASRAASSVSAVPRVREVLVAMQRKIAEGIDVIMDGRDIGTHVLPNASIKVFLVAAPEVRARRRYDELRAKGSDEPYEKVLQDMIERDKNDSTRAASPLRKADDAIELDTSGLSIDEVVQAVVQLCERAAEA